MKFVFAPDSFKGTLSAAEICMICEQAARRHFGSDIITCSVPLADGGEGTIDALLLACGGMKQVFSVHAPYGGTVEAAFGILKDGTYVVEMAQCSGLALSPRREPLYASSIGTGEMLRHVLELGAKNILVCIGGSATNDGGSGFLQALGARFFDADGNIPEMNGEAMSLVRSADLSGLMPELRQAHIDVICDVTNPLLGPTGSTYIYGPQKGADSETLPLLEDGMRNFAEVIAQTLGRDVASLPGSGAAGGMGMALGGVLGASMRKGAETVLELADFDAMLDGASLCLTGEGRLDGQSIRYGKAISGVAAKCAAHHVPLAVLAGGLTDDARAIYDICPAALMVTPDRPMPLEDALAAARSLCEDAADRLFRTLAIGHSLQ